MNFTFIAGRHKHLLQMYIAWQWYGHGRLSTAASCFVLFGTGARTATNLMELSLRVFRRRPCYTAWNILNNQVWKTFTIMTKYQKLIELFMTLVLQRVPRCRSSWTQPFLRGPARGIVKVIRHLLRRQLLLWWYLQQQRVRVRVMIGFLVQGRVRIIEIRSRVRDRVRVGVMFNASIYHRINCRRSKCRTLIVKNCTFRKMSVRSAKFSHLLRNLGLAMTF